MKKFWLLLCFFFIPITLFSSQERFCILIPSYNNAKYVEWNLLSALSQDYENFYIIFIDDASLDQTAQIARDIIEKEDKDEKVVLIQNKSRIGSLANQYHAIHNYIEDEDIVIFLDGDDALLDQSVLSYLNEKYSNPDLWVTYGQFLQYFSKERGYAYAYPNDVIETHSFRSYPHGPTHLRSCKAWLFKKIQKEDLLYEGSFLPVCTNLGTMLPMIEMARDNHFLFIDRVLYLYNDENPLNLHKLDIELQKTLSDYIRTLPSYKAL